MHTRDDGQARFRVGPWVRLLPLVALWAVPVVALAVVIPAVSAREVASVAPPLPSVVTVGSQSTDFRTSVNISVAVEQVGQVRSPVSGLLTSLSLTEGPVRAGQELFAVDGVRVLAQPATSPLFRELRWGDEGADVEVLSRFLIDAGLLPEALGDDAFGPDMRAAVVQLQKNIGATTDGVFRPSYVAYVPPSAGALGEPLITVGSTVTAGEVVLAIAPVPAGIRFTAANSGASLTNLQGTALTLSLGYQQIPVSGLEPAPEELAAIHAGLREAVASGKAKIAAGEGGESGEPEEYSGGLLGLAEPQARGTVPGTAVHLVASGAQCLFRQDGDGWEPVPVPVLESAVGTLGAVFVDATLVDERVARDPLVLADDVLKECR